MKTGGTLARIGVVFSKEVTDSLRDRRTLLVALLAPLLGPLLIALVLVGLNRNAAGEAERVVTLPVYGAEYAPQLVAFLEGQPNVRVVRVGATSRAAVRSGRYDALIEIDPGFGAQLRAARPAPVRVVADSGRLAATGALLRIRALLGAYGRQIGSQRLIARGVDPGIVQAVAVETIEVGSGGKAGTILGLLPLYIVLAAFIGGLYIAIDTTSGERERGSFEPLIINPVARWELVAGKLAATVLFTATVVAETVLALAAGVALVPLDALGLDFSVGPLAWGAMFLVALPLVLLASTLLTLIAAFTRSFREAQSYLTLVTIVPTIPGLLVALFPQKDAWWTGLIPVYAQQVVMGQLLRGEPVALGAALGSAAVTLALAALFAWLAVRFFSGEMVVSGR